MTKFHKIQKLSSIIPFWSTFVVVAITMVELNKHSATKKLWCYFILSLFATGIAVYFVNEKIMTGQHLLLNIIVSSLILAAANVLFVDFQIMSIQNKQEKEKMNSKLYIVVCLVATAISIVVILLCLLFSPSAQIEDTNGITDTSLATIDADTVISSPDSYTALSSHTSFKGDRTNVTGNMKEYDYQECSFSCSKISGIMTLQATKTDSSQLTLNVASKLDEGNMEIVVIVDGKYYNSVPVNQDTTIVLTDIANKTVVVRIAAESAKMKVAIRRG